MPIKSYRALALVAVPLLGACVHDAEGKQGLSSFGDANRQTMMAQVVNPDPQYEFLDPATSAEHAGQAVERYRKGAVKRPDRISTSSESGR